MLKTLIFALALATLAVGDVDYCDSEGLACKKGEHIGCQFKDKPFDFINSACRKWPQAELFNFGRAEIDQIVNEHNQKRSEAGLGNAVPGATAKKLCTMKWDDELAQIASYNVLSCRDDHDECRNTFNFPYVGQNIYNFYNSKQLSESEVIEKTINKWYAERELTTVDDIRSKSPAGHKNGHFTQMVWWNACRIGCAGARWFEDKKYYGYMVCNYNYGNMINEAIFPIGEINSECEEGENKKYPGLCSPDEDIEYSPTPEIKIEGSEVQKNWLKAHGGSHGGPKNVHVTYNSPHHVHSYTHYRVHYH